MIDIENEVFTEIYNVIIPEYPDADVKSVLDLTPATFPCVCVECISNYVNEETSDSGSIENHAVVTFEVTVLTNSESGKKSEAKEIYDLVDSRFTALGFTRTMLQSVSLYDSTIYRLVGRYRAVVSRNSLIYRR